MADKEDEYRDELPDDLQPAVASQRYALPTTRRRRIIAVMCWVVALFSFVIWQIGGSNGVFVNDGSLILGISLTIIGIYCWVSGWKMSTTEDEALEIATTESKMVVGHASAHLGWV